MTPHADTGVVKVDFDLAITMISNTLYKLMANHFERFDSAKPKRVFRNIVAGKADVKIASKEIVVLFDKKAYNPMLRAWAETQPMVRIPWFGGRTLHFEFE